MDTLMHNIRLAARSLRHNAGFTAAAVLTLALGIGLSTAVFTVAEALLFRDLPVRDQDQLVVLWGEPPDRSLTNFPLTLAHAREFARGARSLDRIAFVAYEGAWPALIRDGDRLSRLRLATVSGNFFDVLGAEPAVGRALRAEDDVVGAAPVAVLSYGAWERQFGRDAGAIGRRIVLHATGVAYTIVGVMPRGLDYPRGAEFWAAIVPARTKPGTDSTFVHVNLIGRLAAGATAETARAELTVFHGRDAMPAFFRSLRGVVTPLPRLILGDTRPAVIAFSAAVMLLLLITCINVANLLVVRGIARAREIAVRQALGAGRGRVVVQLLTENLLLAVVGGTLGIATAAAVVETFTALAPATLPRLDEIRVNATALTGAVAITLMSTVVFGLAPAVMSSRIEVQQVLRSGTRQSAGRRSRLAAEALVAGQVALAVLVLAAAGVVARSLIKLESAELAFDPSRLLIAELAMRADQFDTKREQLAVLDRVLSEVRAIPGVRGVSPVVAIPFCGTGGWDGRPRAEGQSAEEGAKNPMLNMEVVTPDYFTNLDVPIVRGRTFTDLDREDAPLVVMLSESAARHYWPGVDPLGQRLLAPGPGGWMTVVGVVPDTRYRDLRTARPSIYFPLSQSFFPYAPTTLTIRFEGRAADLVPSLRSRITAAHPAAALANAAPFHSYLDGPLAQPRLNALLLGVFAGAATLLCAVGLFGVMATTVRQRTREIGVRMALGATPGDVRRMVMRRGLTIAFAGTAIGLAGAVLTNRVVAAMLYDVSPTDGATLALVSGLLLAATALATFLPAHASTRIDPAIALRAES
ncbi:MAG: ABC transporter permease [Gemmatimonadaceae bacterium]